MKEFVNFLLANNCYESFMNAVKSGRYKSLKTLFELSDNNFHGLINRAFTWDKTREGNDYWRDLDIKWNQIYKHKSKKHVYKNKQDW